MLKKSSHLLHQIALILLGVLILFMLLRMPLLEGRAKDLDVFSIYTDPFILYGYITAIPFFMALYAGVLYLESLKKNAKYANQSKTYLNKIKNDAFAFAMMLAAAGLFIKFFHRQDDDPAGFMAITMLCIVAAISVGLWAKGKLKK
jgi:hypothetical protein